MPTQFHALSFSLGNSWGVDNATGEACAGCGAQEQFYACSDIAIGQLHDSHSTMTTSERLHKRLDNKHANHTRAGNQLHDTEKGIKHYRLAPNDEALQKLTGWMTVIQSYLHRPARDIRYEHFRQMQLLLTRSQQELNKLIKAHTFVSHQHDGTIQDTNNTANNTKSFNIVHNELLMAKSEKESKKL